MRVRYIIFLIAILFAAFTKQSDRLIIKGKVTNYSKSYVLFAYDTIGCGISFKVDTIKVDNNGSFEVNTDHLRSNAFMLFEEEEPIKMTIPRSINKPFSIHLDCSKPDSVQFEGEQAALLRFDLAQKKYWKKIFQEMSKRHPEVGLGTGSNQHPLYFGIQDSITQLRIQFLDKYFANSKINGKEDFISNERNSLIYSNLYYRLSGQKNDIIEQLAFYPKSIKNQENSLTYSKEISFSDDNLFEIGYYQSFMNDFIMKSVRVDNPQGSLSSYDFYLEKGLVEIDKWFKSPKANFKQKIVFINHLIITATMFKASVNIDQFQAELDRLRETENVGKYLGPVNDNLRTLKETMSKFSIGKRAPNFELKDFAGKVVHFSDFKNKIIFIDVWASWCGPCVANIPKWNNMVEKYSGNNEFQFISVSIDDNISNWDKALTKFKPSGLKLIAAGGIKSDFARVFQINAIPAYVSIDKDGSILSFSGSISDLQEIITKKLRNEKYCK